MDAEVFAGRRLVRAQRNVQVTLHQMSMIIPFSKKGNEKNVTFETFRPFFLLRTKLSTGLLLRENQWEKMLVSRCSISYKRFVELPKFLG